MPTITPQARPAAVDPANFHQPRKHITHSTGMGPSIRNKGAGAPTEVAEATQVQAPVGQPIIPESTQAPAVTLSPQLTALTRSQQKLQKEIQAQRDKEANWEKEKASYVSKESIKTRLQQNAAEALAELGTNYEEITNLHVAQLNGADPVAALEAKVKAIEDSQVQATEKQFEAIIKQYKSEAGKLVKADAQKFAFLDANPDWIDGAVQYIVDEWEANPDKEVSLDEALALAEENLRDDAKKHASILEKIKAPQTTAEAPVIPGKKTLPPPRTATAARTLTHAVESGTPTRTTNQFQHMNMKERLAAAVARASR